MKLDSRAIASESAKVCFLTAIYGNYELSCKAFVPQSVPTDFICMTDNPNIVANGWIIDTTPYHMTHPSPLDTGKELVNSFFNNRHTFNVAKYYKQAFHNIPRLAQYDAVVWLDGTVQIIHDKVSQYILDHIQQARIIGWHHERRFGKLSEEVRDSAGFYRYNTTFWNNQTQPFQDVVRQYQDYLQEGYDESWFRDQEKEKPHIGVWLTCFVAFSMKDPYVVSFLDEWYKQTLKYTTQDQISFPFVCYKKKLLPLTLPNQEIHGSFPHNRTMFYIKHAHGR
jgi:hypothetical protein